jgi:hypothetical protein
MLSPGLDKVNFTGMPEMPDVIQATHALKKVSAQLGNGI